MDTMQILQTVGICVGALALVAIAVMLFFIFITFLPPRISEDDVIEVIPWQEGTPQPSRRSKRRKGSPNNG